MKSAAKSMIFTAGVVSVLLSACSGNPEGDDGSSPTPSSPTPAGPTPVSWEPPGDDPATGTLELGDALEALFSLETVKTFRIHISEEEWNGLLHDFDVNPRNELNRRADLTFDDGLGHAQALPNVGFRLRGNTWSRVRPEAGETGTLHDPANPLVRAHFRLKFNEQFDGDESVYGAPSRNVPTHEENKGRELVPGVEALNLKFNNDDPTYLREVFSYDLFHRAGVQAARATYAQLFIQIGDEPEQNMGVFALLEALDKDWVTRRFGDNGFLFKCLYQAEGPADLYWADWDGSSSSGQIGIEYTDPADQAEASSWDSEYSPYRPSYDLKTRGSDFTTAEAALSDLITQLRSMPNRDQLSGLLDVESLLRAYAVSVYVGMSDDYWRLANNYYLLSRPTDGRWLWVPYDYDRSFGIETVGATEATSSLVSWGSSRVVSSTQLMDRVLAIPAYQEAWRYYLTEFGLGSSREFDEEAMLARMRSWQALMGPLAQDPDAVDYFPYSEDLGEIQAFIESRLTVAEGELRSSGG